MLTTTTPQFNTLAAMCGSFTHETSAMDLCLNLPPSETSFFERPDPTAVMLFSYGRVLPLTEACRRAESDGLLSFDTLQAMNYVDPLCKQSLEQLRAALPFTLEYQAVLAFESGDFNRSESLATHLLNLECSQEQILRRGGSRLAMAMVVSNRIERMLQVQRGLSDADALALSTDIMRFALTAPVEPLQ